MASAVSMLSLIRDGHAVQQARFARSGDGFDLGIQFKDRVHTRSRAVDLCDALQEMLDEQQWRRFLRLEAWRSRSARVAKGAGGLSFFSQEAGQSASAAVWSRRRRFMMAGVGAEAQRLQGFPIFDRRGAPHKSGASSCLFFRLDKVRGFTRPDQPPDITNHMPPSSFLLHQRHRYSPSPSPLWALVVRPDPDPQSRRCGRGQ
jgi:hypothetical protein